VTRRWEVAVRPWQRPAHQLPIIVRPAAGELLVSYVARLADANGVPAGHSITVGLERISGDHHPGQLQIGQQRLEGGHLAGGAVDLALGQHRTSGMLHHRQQVDLPAA
jgi:hypothetical protein